MRWRLASAVALIMFAAAAPVRAQQPPPAQPQGEPDLVSTGSGFILTSSGYIATNYHVVRDATRLEVRIPGRPAAVRAIVLAKDIENDLAILKAETTPLGNTPIAFADPAQVKVGQDAFVLGYPLGDIMGGTVRLSTGTVSSLYGIQDDPRVYQISNPIQPGNSGGPLFNKDGQLFGVVVSQLDARMFLLNQGIIPQNINFALKGTLLRTLLQTLPEGPDVLRRSSKVNGTREQQVATLSPWVVKVINYRAAITEATRDYRRSPSATMRVDLLGGKMAFYVDPVKWLEAAPEKAGEGQRFFMVKGEARASVFIQIERDESSFDALKAGVLRRLQANLPDARITAQEKRVVNGMPLLTVQIDATPPAPDAPVSFLAQFYTGPEGTVQLVGFTDRDALEQFRPELDEFLSGLEKPKDPSVKTAPWLTEWTRKTIRRLDSPLLMRVFARESEVARYQSVLTSYEDAAPGVFVEYVDPDKSPELAKAAGIRKPGTIDFEYKGRSMLAVADGETDITKALTRLVGGPQKIYFTQVHAERDLASDDKDGFGRVAAWLAGNNYSLERLVPTADNTVPADAAAVVAAGPKRDFSANQVAMLKKYLAAGGRVLLLLDPPDKIGGGPMPNLVALAKEWGIEVGNNVVIDTSGAGKAIGANESVAVATTYPTHAVTRAFNVMTAFPLARSVTPISGGTAGRIALSFLEVSAQSWTETDVNEVLTSGNAKFDAAKGDKKGPVSIGAAIAAKPAATVAPNPNMLIESRFVVIGDSDFAANAGITIQGNSELFANLIDWLSEPIPPADKTK